MRLVSRLNLKFFLSLVEDSIHDRPKFIRPNKKTDLTRFAIENDHHKKKIDAITPRNPLHSQESMIGFQFAHRFVARMTSNASQISGTVHIEKIQTQYFGLKYSTDLRNPNLSSKSSNFSTAI